MERQDSERAFTISNDLEALEVFTLADDLEIFSKLIEKISTLCSEYYEIIDDGSGKRMTETEFYSLVNKHYFQLAAFFPCVSSKNLPYEELIFRSFKMLASIIGLEIVVVLFYLFIE